jgi:uncharacterized protein involved in exopolysaccharide biosynthesis
MQAGMIGEEIEVAEAPIASSQDLHLLDLLLVFAKRRRFIVRFSLASATLAAVVVLVLPSRYTAETVVLPPGQNSSMSSALLSQAGGAASLAASSLGLKNPGDLVMALFRSRTVEDSMIKRFGLMERYHAKKSSEARSSFESHSKLALGTKDGLITISVVDRDPKEAAALANGYVEEYRKLSSDLAVTEASQRRLFFQQQLLEANESLATAENALKTTQQSTGVLQVDTQARSLIQSAAELRAQVVAKQVEVQGMRTYDAEDNPDLVQAKQQLAALQAQLAKLTGTNKDSGADFSVSKSNIPEAGMEYIRKLRDVRYYETITELMGKQFELAKLDEARQGAVLQVVDPAVVPDTRSFPKRALSIVAAVILGFFLACGCCIVVEALQRIKSNPDELQRLDALRTTLRS